MDTEVPVMGNLSERGRLQENIKVYTRRSRIKSLKDNRILNSNGIAKDKDVGTSKERDREDARNDNNDTVSDHSVHTLATRNLNSVQEAGHDTATDQTIQIVAIEDLNLVQEKDNSNVHEPSLQVISTSGLYSVQEKENVPQSKACSEDPLLDLIQPLQVAVENGHELPSGNGLCKPIISKVDGRVRISLLSSRSNNEVRMLKRKLEGELDQVRSLVQRLNAKKIWLTRYSASNGGYDGGHNHLHSQAKEVIAQARANSVVGSIDHYDSRPFQHLSVQVFENNHDTFEFGEKEKRTPKENRYYRSSEFLLAKDRLPPAESNKKLKTNGVRKHGGEMGYAFLKNRCTAQALKSCNNLLARLMRHKFAWVFNKPVDAEALGLHDYHYIIRKPMDLGTIKSKLAMNRYKSPREFAEDVRLTFRNAMTYNPRGHDVYIMAEQLWNTFEDKWVAIESEFNYDWRYGVVQDLGLPSPLSRKVHPPPPSFSRPPALDLTVLERAESMTMPTDSRLKPKTPVRRTPVPKKPKVTDPDKRDMTYNEKQRLSNHLQNLPSEKVDAIVQIIKKGNSSLCQHDDQIELDIDSVDTETLWELDRFVTNYKKNLSKRKRRAELALQARAEGRPAVSATNHEPAVTQAPKASTKDQNNFPTFPLPGDRLGGSSSSSSSSSDSDSDSSDSDSDSSSGCRSDAGHSPKT